MLEAGASLMLRDVARNVLRRECLYAGTRSLDTPVAGCEDAHLTYRDLLPDTFTPADDIAARELDALARAEAAAVFDGLSFRRRLGLLAKLEGVPLYDDELLALCNCRKSMLSREVRAALAELPKYLQQRYPGESSGDIRALAVAVLRALGNEIISWVRVENLLPGLFQ